MPHPTREAAAAAAIAGVQERSAQTQRAHTEPFPGPLAEAFAAEPKTIHGLTLRPVVAADFILLRQLNSPLYRQTAALAEHQQRIKCGQLPADAPPPKTDFEEEEAFEMIYQFTIPVKQARRELAAGRAQFRERALEATADQLNPLAVPDVVQAIVANFLAAFATAIEHGAAKAEGEEVVFSAPPAEPRTGSAGGSVTFPASPATTAGASSTSSTNCP